MADDSGGDIIADVVARIDWPDRAVAQEATARWRQLTKPEGALGRLEALGTWWASTRGECPPAPPQRPVLVIVAGDHGVARTARTSAYPPEVTAQMVRTFLTDRAAANALARQVGARVRVVDASVDAEPDYVDDLDPTVASRRVRRASGSVDREDAMTLDEAREAISTGIALAEAEVDAGADLLIIGDMGIGNTTAAAAIIGLLGPADILSVVGRGTGIDDATWMRKAAAVRDAMRRGKPHKASPIDLLAAIGGPDLAAMVGLLLGTAARRTPVILDGTVIGAAALIAHRAAYKARDWWQAGHQSTEPAHAIALGRLDLAPLLDLQMRLGEGTGALLAVPLVGAAAAALSEMLTFSEAGVSTAESE
jgi:nicotinate-nucleotide--dimethylbenzimidazole phosphoribosyltransferase